MNCFPALIAKITRWPAVALLLLGAAATLAPPRCQACDTAMMCAWRRTFYAQNALATPLRGYFILRSPNCDCWGAPWSGEAAPACACVPLPPAEFLRLGQIPNDGQVAGPPTAAGR
jgi:hypothetical protein